MSGMTDRSAGDNRTLFLLIICIALAAAGGGFFWLRASADQPHSASAAAPGVQSPAQPVSRNEPLAVTIYYPQNGKLVAGTASVQRQPDAQAQARETLAAELSDQRVAQAAVFRDIKLKAFFLDDQGTAYIDLARSGQGALSASADDEFLALYAMVDTVVQNVDEIKNVRFLVDGREAETLAGHADLSRTFTKRTDLIQQ